MSNQEEFERLLETLPPKLASLIDPEDYESINEIIVDFGRWFEYRVNNFQPVISDYLVQKEDLDFCINSLSEFRSDGRVGIPGTLHRVSCVWDKNGEIVGLTYRVGKDLGNSLDLILDLVEKGSILILGRPGIGKAQPLSSKIMTPNGWTTMGEISLGDLVTTKSGKSTPVVGIFPQGKKKVYKVTLDDGTSTECCEDHLWEVTERDYARNQKVVVKSLKEILKDYKKLDGKYNRRKYSVPVNPTVDFYSRDLKIDPYLMGALLGDGGLSYIDINFSSVDEEILNKVNETAPEGYSLKLINRCTYRLSRGKYGVGKECSLKKALRYYGVFGHLSYSKFIPEDFLINSRENRIALLQGLMDTDGSISPIGNSIEFSTSSPKLAQDFLFLVRSLGCKAKLKERRPWYTYKGEKKRGAISYRIFFTAPPDLQVFYLERKKKRAFIGGCKQSRYTTRYISNIELVRVEECQCIEVQDRSHLYMTDDFILTHNTSTLRKISRVLSEKKRTIVVDKSSEIGGESNPPQSSIALSRRFEVPPGKNQEKVMIYALESHTPECMIIDEISTEEEAFAAVTISQRGVQLVATAHGAGLDSLINNPPLNHLIGTISEVTLTDERATKTNNGNKRKRERDTHSIFDYIVEMKAFDEVHIYRNVDESVDEKLKGSVVNPEIRRLLKDKVIVIQPYSIRTVGIMQEDKPIFNGRSSYKKSRS